jgi:TonB family protein
METIIQYIITTGEAATVTFWLPVLMWTLLALIVTGILKLSPGIHAYSRFYIYEALMVALPAGLLAALFINPANWIYPVNTVPGIFYAISTEIMITVPDPAAGNSLRFWSHPYFYSGLATLFAFVLVIFHLVRLGLSYGTLVRLRNTLPVVEDPQLLSRLDDLVSGLHPGRNVRLLTSSEIKVPMTFGSFKPVIVLPENTGGTDADIILVHELTHICRGDYLWMWVEQIIRAVFAFHPLVYQIGRNLEHYREICCDAEVLNGYRSPAPSDYAMALVKYLKNAPGPDLTSGMGRSSNIKERITVMNEHKHTPLAGKRIAGMAAGVLLLGGTILFMACTDNIQGSEDGLTLNGSTAELQNVTTTELTGMYSGLQNEISEYLQDYSNIRMESMADIRIDHPALAEKIENLRIVTAELRNRNDLPAGFSLDEMPGTGKAADPDLYSAADRMPELLGGQKALYDAISYPETAKNAGIEGRVVIQFVVDVDGNVTDPRILRGIGGGADEAAISAISQMRFTPAMHEGKPVRVQLVQPVVFRLPVTPAEEPE